MLQAYIRDDVPEAGCDEAGRGCLAGPVVAAAVIFKPGYRNERLMDSKKLDDQSREELTGVIVREAEAWAVEMVHPEQIDEINILQASVLAMHMALDRLDPTPGHVIVDGNYFKPWKEVPHQCLVKGDDRFLSIAAASILAKHFRDQYMIELDGMFPHYGWASNKGYPTVSHKQMIVKHGLTRHHRKTFNWRPTPRQLKLAGL